MTTEVLKRSTDPLGDRLKAVERIEAGRRADPSLPILARLDGRAFSTFTRGLKRPFDPGLVELMIGTTARLIEEFHALVGYTQSDEITLVWAPHPDQPFGGKYQKLTSILAATATGFFQKNLARCLPEKADANPSFDCRVWQPPNMDEAYMNFIWRQDDALKNSVNMAAYEYFSHKQLMGVGNKVKLDMLREKRVDWNDYPAHFKWGTYVKAENVLSVLSSEELERIPELFRPTGPVVRTYVRPLELDSPVRAIADGQAIIFKRKSS